jgi:hypothetical protein
MNKDLIRVALIYLAVGTIIALAIGIRWATGWVSLWPNLQ